MPADILVGKSGRHDNGKLRVERAHFRDQFIPAPVRQTEVDDGSGSLSPMSRILAMASRKLPASST